MANDKLYKTIIELLRDANPLALFDVGLMTIPNMNKKDNPYYGKVRKISVYNNCILGFRYPTDYNNYYRPNLSPNDGWIIDDMLLHRNGKSYLYLFATKATSKDYYYIYQGYPIMRDNIFFKDIVSFDKNACANKSRRPNLNDDRIIFGITPRIENIFYIRQGNKVYSF